MHRWLARASLLSILVLAAACDNDARSEHPGAALYETYCAVCHGADGRSPSDMPSTPHLNSQGLLTSVDDAFLYESTARGRPGDNGRGKPGTKMSVFGAEHGGPLSRREIEDIVGYIRLWQTEPSVEIEPFEADGDPSVGADVYDRQCAACHGADGWSVLAPSLAGSTFQETASDAYIRHTILNGRPGSTMPALLLDDDEVHDVIAFVRSLYDASDTQP